MRDAAESTAQMQLHRANRNPMMKVSTPRLEQNMVETRQKIWNWNFWSTRKLLLHYHFRKWPSCVAWDPITKHYVRLIRQRDNKPKSSPTFLTLEIPVSRRSHQTFLLSVSSGPVLAESLHKMSLRVEHAETKLGWECLLEIYRRRCRESSVTMPPSILTLQFVGMGAFWPREAFSNVNTGLWVAHNFVARVWKQTVAKSEPLRLVCYKAGPAKGNNHQSRRSVQKKHNTNVWHIITKCGKRALQPQGQFERNFPLCSDILSPCTSLARLFTRRLVQANNIRLEYEVLSYLLLHPKATFWWRRDLLSKATSQHQILRLIQRLNNVSQHAEKSPMKKFSW